MELSHSALSNLRKSISATFNLAELGELCFDLGIEFEDLAGNTKDSRARELVLFFVRRNELPTLMSYLKRVRPKHNWDESIGMLNSSDSNSRAKESLDSKSVSIKNSTINIINTNGGSVIGGNVNAGGDFTGRDKT